MFDIGFFELIVIGILALLVLGPERLPKAARTAGMWIGRIKQGVSSIQQEVNQQLHIEEMQRQLEDNRRKLEETLRQQEQSITESSGPKASSIPESKNTDNKDTAADSEPVDKPEVIKVRPEDEGPFGTSAPDMVTSSDQKGKL
ncbi:Sec-independent protein translocase protein TatB [Oceanospirillum maris]|jgi:sec-independent protein translocase protein TatB|uniref:Sec-independent protein translocase protein TatB n=1 Tax=Oceanospirillum maris TaxID=64977 RepID=UPI0003FC5958|nr:Sec-independent protein translocase protein TatB [Oceanospirillum maris]